MLWKMQCCTLQSMGHTNHKFHVYATRNVVHSLPHLYCHRFIVIRCGLVAAAHAVGAIWFGRWRSLQAVLSTTVREITQNL